MKYLLTLCLVVSLLLVGCTSTTGTSPSRTADGAVDSQDHPLKEWMKAQPRAKKKGIFGALIGAASGALAASVTGRDPWAGAAAGAVAGGLAGYLVGKHKDKIYGSRDQAIREIGYDPSMGYVFQVQEVDLEPTNPEPGQSIEVHVRYLVLGPDPKEELTIHSFTGVKYDEDYVMGDGPSKFTIPRGGGIVDKTFEITLPEEAPDGSYTIEALFEDGGGRFQEEGSSPLYLG